MYERTLHLKVEASQLYRFLERKLPQDSLTKVEGTWWDADGGHGFLLFRRVFLRVLGMANLIIQVENLNGQVSRIKLTGYSPTLWDWGVGEEIVAKAIRVIRRQYTDGCLEQAHEEAWRYLEELGFSVVSAAKWRKNSPPVAYISTPIYRGVASVQLSRDGCGDTLVREFSRDLMGFRQYDQAILGGLLIVGCPEGIPEAPFLTDPSLIQQIERHGFTLIGFRRLENIVSLVRQGRLTQLQGQEILTRFGLARVEQYWSEAAAASEE